MSNITCTRKIGFDAAHRVVEHESKCKYVHGHRYTVAATFAANEHTNQLDGLGRVIDFGVIKEKLGTWIDDHWDHTIILWDKDKKLGEVIASETNQVPYYIPMNPTAENLAVYLLEVVCPKLFSETDIHCTSITIDETPNCFAKAEL